MILGKGSKQSYMRKWMAPAHVASLYNDIGFVSA